MPGFRRLLIGIALLGAAAFGARWLLDPGLGSKLVDPASRPAGALFAARFVDAGGTLQPLAQWRGRVLVINFWATWCPPCVKEMPLLEQFHREHGPGRRPGPDGWTVLGVAIDRPQAVVEFLSARPVSYEIVVAGLDGTTWGRALGNDKGGLPFTVAIDTAGRISHRKIGEIAADELQRWAQG